MGDERDIFSKTIGTSTRGGEDGVQPDCVHKNFIICIGVSKYQEPAFNTLGDSCKHDCEDLINILQSDFSFEPVKGYYDSNANKQNDNEQVLYNEEATKENIRLLFEHLAYHPDFCVDKNQPDLPNHNLVIYFSGHGEALSNNSNDLFYFVPYDYNGSPLRRDRLKLYSIANGLIPNFDNIRFHSIVLIIDACHSAATFNLSHWVDNKPVSHKGNERSVWALCSSAMDEASFWDRKERNSCFTLKLLDILKQPDKLVINLEQLCIDIKQHFRNEKQTVYSGRLLLIADNVGDFYFRGNENRLRKQLADQRRAYLMGDLLLINFTDQEDSIKEWKKSRSNQATHYLLFLSTKQEYGLKVAHRRICYSPFFPVKQYRSSNRKRCFLHVIKNLRTDQLSMIEIVSSMLDDAIAIVPKWGNSNLSIVGSKVNEQVLYQYGKNELMAKLVKKLKTAPVILEIVIDEEKIDPQVKEAFLKALLALLAELKFEEKILNPFCVIVLDAEGYNYTEKFEQYSGANLQTYFMPEVCDLNDDALSEWYAKILMSRPDEKADEFEKLLKDIIESVKNDFLNGNSHAIGKFIEALCEKCGCPDLAIQILKF
jgi:hypothetical protein